MGLLVVRNDGGGASFSFGFIVASFVLACRSFFMISCIEIRRGYK